MERLKKKKKHKTREKSTGVPLQVICRATENIRERSEERSSKNDGRLEELFSKKINVMLCTFF